MRGSDMSGNADEILRSRRRAWTDQDAERLLVSAKAVANGLWSTMTREQLIEYLDWDDDDPEHESLWHGLVVRINTYLVASWAWGADMPDWVIRPPSDPNKTSERRWEP